MIPYTNTNRPSPLPEVPAIVRTVTARDVLWNRPLFKAPPLRVKPPVPDAKDFAEAGTVSSLPRS